MMTEFAKLYQSDQLGQILFLLDEEGDDGAEIKMYFRPEGLGLCSMRFGYETDEEGEDWQKAQSYFATITAKTAIESAEAIIESILDSGIESQED
jgi:hypothetical protein